MNGNIDGVKDLTIYGTGTNRNIVLFAPSNKIVFGPKAIMVLDENGLTYKGQRIEDAGEAYRAIMETIGGIRKGKDAP